MITAGLRTAALRIMQFLVKFKLVWKLSFVIIPFLFIPELISFWDPLIVKTRTALA